MLDYSLVSDLGFEDYAETSTYEGALNIVQEMMEDHNSNCIFIYDRVSGDTPFKVMVIPGSRTKAVMEHIKYVQNKKRNAEIDAFKKLVEKYQLTPPVTKEEIQEMLTDYFEKYISGRM